MRARAGFRVTVAALTLAACAPDAPKAAPPATFAFGVFGDAPYSRFDERAYGRMLEDIGASNARFAIHIGDLHGGSCADAVLESRRSALATLAVPVIYTPGDNEWTDCHGRGAGGYRPLERLARIRSLFFANPSASLGAHPLRLESQGSRAEWREFVENARWTHGGFVFTTVHLVGSGNGTMPFTGRSADDDEAARRRMNAANAWLDEAFAVAARDSLRGVFVAMHADPYFEFRKPTGVYEPFLAHLAERVAGFGGIVVLMHGDSHMQRADQPLLRPGTRDTLRNFTRVETFGSPEVGWVRILVDTANGKIASIEPRLMPKTLGM